MTGLIGLAPEAALAALGDRAADIVYNHPPRGAEAGAPRVVRVREACARVELTVCVFPILSSEDVDADGG